MEKRLLGQGKVTNDKLDTNSRTLFAYATIGRYERGVKILLKWEEINSDKPDNCWNSEAARHAHHIESAINPLDLHITHGHGSTLLSDRSAEEVSAMRSGSIRPPGASSFMLLSMPQYRSTNLRTCACDR